MAQPTERRVIAAATVMLAALLLLAACGADEVETAVGEPEATPTPDRAAPPIDEGAGDEGVGGRLLVLPGDDARFPSETKVQCGNSPLFAAGALESPTLFADTAIVDEAAFVPLAEFLGSAEGDYWPQVGYWVLANDERSLLLAHVGTHGEVTLVGSEFADGSWGPSALQGGGACPIRVPLPAGMHEVNWRLDPDVPNGADSSSVALLATGQACSGGQPMGDRLKEPQALINDTTVYLVLVATYPEGEQTCQGVPEEQVTIELAEPLDGRPIVNAREAAGVLTDYLPVSPCGQIAPAIYAASGDTGTVVLDGPADRTTC